MLKRPNQTGIVNRAAARLGTTQRVASISDQGELAQHARAHWDGVVTTLLADHPWNFAIRRATLNASAIAPNSEYTWQYQLPADCWRVLPWLRGDPDWYTSEVEGGYILTDAEAPIKVRYISGELGDQVGLWPPHFAEAVELELALRLCEPMTGNASAGQRLQVMAGDALTKAKKVDGLESNGRSGPNVQARSRWGQRRFLRSPIPGFEYR